MNKGKSKLKMAKIRVINTRFWIDDYTSNLDPIEKLVFLYFLTNPMTDICGIYEIPLKIIAVETGIDREMVLKILGRFERDDKIFYENGWVAIKNFKKHQTLNPKVIIGIENGLSKAPKSLLGKLCIDYNSLSHLNSNLNPNLNSNLNPNAVAFCDNGERLGKTSEIRKGVKSLSDKMKIK